MAEHENHAEHDLVLRNRSQGTITGVTDVISFDEKEIRLKTKAGVMTVKGENLTLTRLDLDRFETDIQGKVDGILYTKELPKNKNTIKAAVRRWW